MIDKLEEPVYDHRARIKERSRPLQKCNDNQPISVFWEIGGAKSHCLIDSRCEGIMISVRICFLSLLLPDYAISAGPKVKGCDWCSGSSSA